MTPTELRRDMFFRRHGSDALIPLFPKPHLGIGITRTRQDETTKLHTHEFTEIAIVEHGRGTQCYDQSEFKISLGDVFVIHPDRPHSLRGTRDLDLINVLFVDDGSIPLLSDLSTRSGYRAMFALEPALRHRDDPQRRLRLAADQLRIVTSIVDRLESVLYGDAPESATASIIHFLELITIICECYETSPSRGGRILTDLGKAISHIDRHFTREIRVEDLAKVTHMSLRSFQRHFQKVFGVSPSRYILERRIAEARELLQHADRTVSEIAFDVGFLDPTYFSRAFRTEVGVSPKKYQLEH